MNLEQAAKDAIEEIESFSEEFHFDEKNKHTGEWSECGRYSCWRARRVVHELRIQTMCSTNAKPAPAKAKRVKASVAA